MSAPYVEKNCTLTHEGRTFEAGGAYVVGDRALVYITRDAAGVYWATDWHGAALGRVLTHKVGARRWTGHGYYCMAYVRVEIDGREWWGRYNSDNQAVRLRAKVAP